MSALDQTQDVDEQEHQLHAQRRPACEHALGKICRCSCGGRYHRHGMPYLAPMPATRARGAQAHPRRIRRHSAQLGMLLLT